MNQNLNDIYEEYKNDPAFSHLKTKFVGGEGNTDSPLYFFIGEAPGKEENLQERPFVGPAGQLLRKSLKKFEIEDFFLTNVLKYRPPENRRPVADERILGRKYLIKEIAATQPKFIVLLGGTALVTFFGSSVTITRKHGTLMNGNYFALYHPAAAIYDESKQAIIDEDFATLVRIGNSYLARDADR